MAVATKGGGVIRALRPCPRVPDLRGLARWRALHRPPQDRRRTATAATPAAMARSALDETIRVLEGCEVVLCSKIGFEPWGPAGSRRHRAERRARDGADRGRRDGGVRGNAWRPASSTERAACQQTSRLRGIAWHSKSSNPASIAGPANRCARTRRSIEAAPHFLIDAGQVHRMPRRLRRCRSASRSARSRAPSSMNWAVALNPPGSLTGISAGDAGQVPAAVEATSRRRWKPRPADANGHVVFYEKPGCATTPARRCCWPPPAIRCWRKSLLDRERGRATRLRAFFGELPVADWFNPSAPRIKSRRDRARATGRGRAALDLMLADPLLIRRPLMEVGRRAPGRFRPVTRSIAGSAWRARTCRDDDLEACTPEGHAPRQPSAPVEERHDGKRSGAVAHRARRALDRRARPASARVSTSSSRPPTAPPTTPIACAAVRAWRSSTR